MGQREKYAKSINAGRAVIIKGKHYNRIVDLPSEADLSVGDPKKEAATAEQLKKDIEKLHSELAKVEKEKAAEKADAKAAAKEEPKADAKAEKAEAKSDAKK